MASVLTLLVAGFALGLVAGMSPGPDTVLVVRATVSGGRRAGTVVAVGIGAALAIHASLTAALVGGADAALPWLSPALSVAGSAYLTYLGATLLVRSGEQCAAPRDPHQPVAHPFVTGFLTNLLNPKAVIFFAAVVSQLLADRSVALMVAFLAGVVLGPVSWFIALSVLVATVFGSWLRRHQRAVDIVSACALLALASYGLVASM